MKATAEELDEAIRRIHQVPDREIRSELFGELVTWSSLRYNEIEIEEIRARMSLSLKELMLISPIGEEIVRETKEVAREEGRREGSLESAKKNVIIVAETRFPGLLTPEAIEPVTDEAVLRQFLREIAVAQTREAAAEAIQPLLPK